MQHIKDILIELRVHHYIKNILVFIPLCCSGMFLDLFKLKSVFLIFLLFCLLSSIVYIINDMRDIEKDKKHPVKRNRPIASGRISKREGQIIIIVLAAVIILVNIMCFNTASWTLQIIYLILNLLYSLGAKNVPLLDVVILASGFLIRVLLGASVCDIQVSNWLYLTILSLAFYFAFGKRRGEMVRVNEEGETRQVLKEYSVGFLDKFMYLCLSLANVFYALWSIDDITIQSYSGGVFTSFGLCRFS